MIRNVNASTEGINNPIRDHKISNDRIEGPYNEKNQKHIKESMLRIERLVKNNLKIEAALRRKNQKLQLIESKSRSHNFLVHQKYNKLKNMRWKESFYLEERSHNMKCQNEESVSLRKVRFDYREIQNII